MQKVAYWSDIKDDSIRNADEATMLLCYAIEQESLLNNGCHSSICEGFVEALADGVEAKRDALLKKDGAKVTKNETLPLLKYLTKYFGGGRRGLDKNPSRRKGGETIRDGIT